jgi:hypothetical protein
MTDGFVFGFAFVCVAVYAFMERADNRPHDLRSAVGWFATVALCAWVVTGVLLFVGLGGPADRAHM